MIKVSVPSSRRVDDAHSSFTVFRINVFISGRCHVLEKRYNDFEELHKKLKKTIKTPDFPSKHVLKYHPKIIEQRRVGFESYLQGIIYGGTVPTSLLMFLGVQSLNIYDNSDSLERNPIEKEGLLHQPVIKLDNNLLMLGSDDCQSDLPDIVTEGALSAIYGTPFR